ncbi:putative NUDIX hydrolase [Corynebacterium kalinowskii]|uniref:NUDIX hydrolase n=1 Tax=Corynebacterium kalinowskii TaxID=2675216 RepID=A0A6B8VWF7_9CORY|nr:CoA pyrophosphatase [Corynebacterium kalinowskii]QGU03016.1 putative NUDIX hydrolase [Corynebacterium kalinowskii]
MNFNGINTALRPNDSPEWLRPLVASAKNGSLLGGLGLEDFPSTKRAAVLILLEGAGLDDAAVLLTHRTPTMRSHSGQVAFPGGRMDPEDRGPVDCALREAWEETGLDRRTVIPLAELDPVGIRATGNPVIPILGYWQEPRDLDVVSPLENDDIFRAPLTDLVNPDNRFIVRKGSWSGPAFWHRGYVIWGFTGGLLTAMIRHAGWEEPWSPLEVDLETALRGSRNGEM